MHGLHLTADLRGCGAAALLRDADALCHLLHSAVARVGLTTVGARFHRFPAGGGVTGVLLLAESHLAVHTWPELHGATLDVYVCNHASDNAAAAVQLMDALVAALAPQHAMRQQWARGWPDGLQGGAEDAGGDGQ